jgi:hypothetical protein
MGESQVVKMIFGSHVYGTNTPESDLDYKAVFIPSARDILLQRSVKVSRNRSTGPGDAKNAPGDIDIEEFSLHGYLKLLCEGQTVAVDMLFVPDDFYEDEPLKVWRTIQARGKEMIPAAASAFVGYCRSQANKYGIKGSRMNAARDIVDALEILDPDKRLSEYWEFIKSVVVRHEHMEIIDIVHPHSGASVAHLSVCGRKMPETIRVRDAVKVYGDLWEKYGDRARAAASNQGVDWKALMHAVRVLGQAKELLSSGFIKFPRPDAEFLKEIRLGKRPYKEVAELIEDGIENQIPALVEASVLPTVPDYSVAEGIIQSAYGKKVTEVIPW